MRYRPLASSSTRSLRSTTVSLPNNTTVISAEKQTRLICVPIAALSSCDRQRKSLEDEDSYVPKYISMTSFPEQRDVMRRPSCWRTFTGRDHLRTNFYGARKFEGSEDDTRLREGENFKKSSHSCSQNPVMDPDQCITGSQPFVVPFRKTI